MIMRPVLCASLCVLFLNAPALAFDPLIALAKQYQFKIVVEHPPKATWNEVHYEPLSPDERQLPRYVRYQKLFAQEFAKYPLALVKLAGVRQIALVKELGYAGQKRAALPDFVQDILYLDVYRGESSERYQRHVVHHEFIICLKNKSLKVFIIKTLSGLCLIPLILAMVQAVPMPRQALSMISYIPSLVLLIAMQCQA